jgi:hypothetical protein
MGKKILIILIWFLSLVIISIYTYENPDKIEVIKNYFSKAKKHEIKFSGTPIIIMSGNSFIVGVSKEFSFTERTAFLIHDENVLNFDANLLKIYTQDGYLLENYKATKLNLPDTFTTLKNGGVKSIFIHNKSEFALISSLKNDCYYASIILLNNSKELLKTKCLPKEEIDFNGLGSSHIHHNGKILLSIGTPEQSSSAIRALAQDTNSMFGKILEINNNDLDKIIKGEKINLEVKMYTLGHRNPQGLTKMHESFFSVEHGPKGGDELNKIIKDKNYGWPKVSFGTRYLDDNKGKSILISHENNGFEAPLVALVPSVAISSINQCPLILKNYYKKNCLMALSLHGNKLRPGKSIIIFLLNENMDKVQSVEKIYFGKLDNLKFRHFVTNSKNELYEDDKGSIYISADQKGIYKITFRDFR